MINHYDLPPKEQKKIEKRVIQLITSRFTKSDVPYYLDGYHGRTALDIYTDGVSFWHSFTKAGKGIEINFGKKLPRKIELLLAITWRPFFEEYCKRFNVKRTDSET